MHVLVRIFIKEYEEKEGKPLHELLVEELKEKGIRGVTVIKAILGYGTTGEMYYEGIESLSYNLPMVIEFVEEEEKAIRTLEGLSSIPYKGLITMERVQVWE